MPTWAIILGAVLHLIAMGTIFAGFLYAMRRELDQVKTKLDLVWKAWSGGDDPDKSVPVRLGILEHNVANHEDRLNAHARRLGMGARE